MAKKKDYQDNIDANAANLLDAQRIAASMRQQQIQQARAQYAQAQQEAAEQQQQISATQETSFAEMMAEMHKQYEQERQIAAQQEANEKQVSQYGSLIETASALANLAAVAGGAVSQHHRPFTQDWMRQAEQKARERKARLHGLHDRQVELNARLSAIRASNAKSLSELRLNQAYNVMKAQETSANTMYNDIVKAAENQYRAANDIAKAEFQEKKLASENANAAARIQASVDKADKDRSARMAAKGYIPDANSPTGYSRDARLYAPSKSSMKLSLAASSDGSLPAEVIEIKPESLFSTIRANIDGISVSPEDKKKIDLILKSDRSENEKARSLTPYVKNNKELRELVRSASASNEWRGTEDNNDEDYGGDSNDPYDQYL